MADYIYDIPYFDGGLNTRFSSHVINDNESPDALNVYLDDAGAVQTRGGSRLYNSHNTLTTGTWYGLTNFEPTSGGSILVGWYNSSMRYLSGTTWVTVPSADGVFTNQTAVTYIQYYNYLFMGDGGTPYKWDGVDFTRMGIEVPSAATITTATTLGSLSGTYMYKINYVNSGLIEGDVGSAVTIQVASGIISMTGIPTAPQSYGVARRYIYRTKADGSTFFFVDELTDNSTTTYKDEVPDSELILQAPTDQGKPPNFHKIAHHKDRLFMVASPDFSILEYTEIGNPFIVKATNFEFLGDGNGSIQSVGIHSDSVISVKDTGEAILLFLGDNSPTNFLQVKANTHYGTTSPFFVNYDDKFMYLGVISRMPVGFISLLGIDPVNEGISTDVGQTQSDKISYRIQPDIEAMTANSLHKVRGIVWRDRAFITFPNADATDNNRMFIFDFNRRTFSKNIGGWFPQSGLSISYFAIHGGKLLGATSGEGIGQVLELDVDALYSDSGAAMDSYFSTKFFMGDKNHSQHYKDWRTLYLYLGLLGAWPIDIYRKIDFESGDGILKQFNMTTNDGVWDTSIWDLATWGPTRTEIDVPIDLGTSMGKRIQFKFTNGNVAGQGFKINKAEIEYQLRTRRR